MKPGTFIINNIYSEELNSLIQERPIIHTPKRKVNMVDISGRSGTLPFDQEAYENTVLPLKLFTHGKNYEEVNYKKELIVMGFNQGTYVDFVPYFDKDKIYKVMLMDGPSFIGNGQWDNVLPYELTLTVKPFKYYRYELKTWFQNGGILVNPSFYNSKPKFIISGAGNCTLTVNGVDFVIKNIEGGITIDSEIEHAYNMAGGVLNGQDSKVFTLDYPILSSGNNEISWTGSIDRVDIEPRWVTLI